MRRSLDRYIFAANSRSSSSSWVLEKAVRTRLLLLPVPSEPLLPPGSPSAAPSATPEPLQPPLLAGEHELGLRGRELQV